MKKKTKRVNISKATAILGESKALYSPSIIRENDVLKAELKVETWNGNPEAIASSVVSDVKLHFADERAIDRAINELSALKKLFDDTKKAVLTLNEVNHLVNSIK
jgi:hypothetical protein